MIYGLIKLFWIWIWIYQQGLFNTGVDLSCVVCNRLAAFRCPSKVNEWQSVTLEVEKVSYKIPHKIFFLTGEIIQYFIQHMMLITTGNECNWNISMPRKNHLPDNIVRQYFPMKTYLEMAKCGTVKMADDHIVCWWGGVLKSF